jgi:transcriptional regulator with XRE-family HTH domain
MQSWSTTLRCAISASGKTDTELARLAGVPQPVLSRFRTGSRSLSLESAEKIAGVIGVVLSVPASVPPKQPIRKTQRKKVP